MQHTLHFVALKNAAASMLAVGMLLVGMGASHALYAAETGGGSTILLRYEPETYELKLIQARLPDGQGPLFHSAPVYENYAAGLQMFIGFLLLSAGLFVHALTVIQRERASALSTHSPQPRGRIRIWFEERIDRKFF